MKTRLKTWAFNRLSDLVYRLADYVESITPHSPRRDLGRGWTDGTGQTLYGVHGPALCEGRACVIHAPSEHRMSGFPTHYRFDRGIMERICTHGVGHPDPDDQAFLRSIGRTDEGVHGCDGCCRETEEWERVLASNLATNRFWLSDYGQAPVTPESDPATKSVEESGGRWS